MQKGISRRTFLMSAGAAAASMFLPEKGLAQLSSQQGEKISFNVPKLIHDLGFDV